MSDDEYDDELPPISVNSLTAKGKQFIMPSADVIASQRAHEEECEQELRQLRSEYECDDVATVISYHDSSSSEGEATLAAAIESMKVNSSQTASQVDAIDLLQKIIANLPDYDTNFLKDYLDVLQKEDVATVKIVTDDVMTSIEHVIKQSLVNGNMLNEQELVVVGLWLCAACLWTSPRVANARRALHVLLTYFTEQQIELFSWTLSRCLGSAALVRASDVAAAPAPRPRRAAAALLRAALAQLAPTHHLEGGCGPLQAGELAAALSGVWRELAPPQQYSAVQVLGRALAEPGPDPAPAGAHPAPDGTHPAPAGTHPAPDGTHPAPDGTHPATAETHPAPDGTHPATAETHPAPAGTHPAPAGTHPAPAGTHPAPAGTHPAPDGTHPAPDGTHPAPTGTHPAPGAVSRLLVLLATPTPQHRFRPDYLKVLMAVSKLQNLFKNYENTQEQK